MNLQSLSFDYSPREGFSGLTYHFDAGKLPPSPTPEDVHQTAQKSFEELVAVLDNHYQVQDYEKRPVFRFTGKGTDWGLQRGTEYVPLHEGKHDGGALFTVKPFYEFRSRPLGVSQIDLGLMLQDRNQPRLLGAYDAILKIEGMTLSEEAAISAKEVSLLRTGVQGDELIRKLLEK